MDSNDVRRDWAERSGEYSPEYYAYYGANEVSEWIQSVLEDVVNTEASVLELGCSSGRHLAHLLDHGYENLHGVDINDEAFDVMADTYPDLAAEGTFYVDAIESLVEAFDDDQFDVVYSVETLQHIHPDDEHVFSEIARIAAELVITVENEGPADDEAGSERDETASDDGRGATETVDTTAGQPVSYVNDEFPLYHRDWGTIFTAFGFTQIRASTDDPDTMRAFGSADE